MNGHRFSVAKGLAINFSRKRGGHPNLDPCFGNRLLSCVETTRYLGPVFDSHSGVRVATGTIWNSLIPLIYWMLNSDH